MSASRRARARLTVLGAALGIGMLAVGAGAITGAGGMTQAPPTVAVDSAAPGTVPPVIGTLSVSTVPRPSSTGPEAASAASAAATPAAAPPGAAASGAPSSAAATVPPVVFTGEFAEFDETLRSALIGHGALAVSVAVARDGELVHANAFGVASQATGEAVTPAHRFRVASNSKLLTAAAVMGLVEADQLGLDEPVLARLAERLGVTPTEPAIAAVTVRQLLSHTSGFPEYQNTFFGGGATSCEDAARRGLTGGLLGPPGTVYRYSNMNFCVLGLLVEEVTGRPYESVVQSGVLSPLGIEDMHLSGTYEVRSGDVAHPTTPGRTFMEALGGAGAWVGTATDLVKIVDGLDRTRPGRHPLSRATLDTMLQPQPGIVHSEGQWYGLGVRVWADGTWGHTGTVENARSMVIRRPDGITWAVTVSGNAPSNTDGLRSIVDRAFATVGVSPPPVTAAAPPAPAPATSTTAPA